MLDVRNFHVAYQGGKCEAVKGVSFSLDPGSLTGLVGESGSGKTTVVTAVLGLLPRGSRIAGKIVFDGRDLCALDEATFRRVRWRKIALVPQGAQNSFTPVRTIGAHIEEVLGVHLRLTGETARRRADELLEAVELPPSLARRYPHELSGGQKQRAAIALALACDPELLLADEPTTALDVITQAGVIKLLLRLKEEKKLTVLLVTHDLPLSASVCDTLLVMKDGEIVERGKPKRLIHTPENPYTRRLVAAIL